MLTNPKNIIFLFTLFVFLSACRKEIVVQIPDPTPILVLNSLFNPDSLWKINLSSTTSLYDNNEHAPFVANATVVLYEDGVLLDTLSYADSGNYVLNTYPAINKTYHLRATAPNYNAIEAIGKIPAEKANLYAGAFTNTTTIFINDLQIPVDYYVLQWDFLDPSNQPNYYLTKLLLYDSTYLDNQQIHYAHLFETIYLFTKDPLSQAFNSDQPIILMNDIAFDGQTKHIEGYTVNNIFYGNNISYVGDSIVTPQKRIELHLQLLTMSEDMYLFQKSYFQNQFNNANPFAEPINLYTNVIGGLGIFAGYQQSSIRIY